MKKIKHYPWEGRGRFSGSDPKHIAFRLQRQVADAEKAGAITMRFLTLELRRFADLAVLHFPRANGGRPSATRELRQKLLAKAQRALDALDAKAEAAGRRRTPKETAAIIQPVMNECGWTRETYFWDQLRRKSSRYRSKKKKPGTAAGQG